MNTLKKALCISFGVLLFIVGLASAFIFVLVGNMVISDKVIAISISVAAAIFGWWLLRRGSKSVWEAISWVVFHLIP